MRGLGGVYGTVGGDSVCGSLSEGIGALSPCRFGRGFPISRQVSIAPGADEGENDLGKSIVKRGN